MTACIWQRVYMFMRCIDNSSNPIFLTGYSLVPFQYRNEIIPHETVDNISNCFITLKLTCEWQPSTGIATAPSHQHHHHHHHRRASIPCNFQFAQPVFFNCVYFFRWIFRSIGYEIDSCLFFIILIACFFFHPQSKRRSHAQTTVNAHIVCRLFVDNRKNATFDTYFLIERWNDRLVGVQFSKSLKLEWIFENFSYFLRFLMHSVILGWF